MADDLIAKARARDSGGACTAAARLDIGAAARMQDMVNQTAQLATLSRRGSSARPRPEDHRRLVADSLGELRAAAAKRQA
jgi:hypothetical protein